MADRIFGWRVWDQTEHKWQKQQTRARKDNKQFATVQIHYWPLSTALRLQKCARWNQTVQITHHRKFFRRFCCLRMSRRICLKSAKATCLLQQKPKNVAHVYRVGWWRLIWSIPSDRAGKWAQKFVHLPLLQWCIFKCFGGQTPE